MKNVRNSGLLTLTMLVFATTVVHVQSLSVCNFGSKNGDSANPSFSGIVAQGRDGRLYSETPSGGRTALEQRSGSHPPGR